MHENELRHVLTDHGGGTHPFHYFGDRYALVALALYAGRGRRIADLRTSPVARLLRKPLVHEVLASLGGGIVRAEDLLAAWPRRPLHYVVTFGRWGRRRGWSRHGTQTSRRGFNVVLRLNFCREHDREFQRLLRAHRWYKRPSGHPVDTCGRMTLAWARLDVDLQRGQALIEEIQSDWLRDAQGTYEAVATGQRWVPYRWRGCERVATERRLQVYNEQVLAPHRRVWAEAVLTAALTFLVRDLSIHRIYYHTFETGNRLKGIRARCLPPRSLYTDLPNRFAFAWTTTPPEFLVQDADGYARHVLKRC